VDGRGGRRRWSGPRSGSRGTAASQRRESADGAKVARGGPGSLMFVPAGCPHAFTNPGTTPARMLFLVTPTGHEQYLEGIAELLSRPGPPDQAAIIELRARYDIEQLTSMIPDRRRAASP